MDKHLLAIALLMQTAMAYGHSYELRLDAKDPNKLHVSAELSLSDRVIYSSHEGSDPSVWIDRISNLQAIDVESNKPIAVKKCGALGVLLCRPKYDRCNLMQPTTCPGFRPGGGKWKLDAKQGSVVRLSYDVDLDFTGQDIPGGIDSAPYRIAGGQYFVGRAIFLANGTYDSPRAITVTFRDEKFGNIVTPWLKGNERKFKAQSNADLLDGIGFWGSLKEQTIQQQALTLRLVTSGQDSKLIKTELSKTLRGVVANYFEISGSAPTDAEKPIALIATVSDDWPSDGEVIGRSISLILNTDGGSIEWTQASLLFAHELFHLWNGKTIAPINSDVEWFREGMSEFFAYQALVLSTDTDREKLRTTYMRESFSRYESDPGRGQLSIVDAGGSKHENWGTVYIGGFYAGMLLEQALRKEGFSAGTVFRRLLERNKSYSLNNVLNAVGSLSEPARAELEILLKDEGLVITREQFESELKRL